MWIRKPGKMSEHLTMLGPMQFPCYTIEAGRSALVDAGVLPIAGFLREHFGPGKRQPNFVLLTHTHYDHVGCLGVLRKLAPRAIVVGSLAASNLLANHKVYEFVVEMNRRLMGAFAAGSGEAEDPAELLRAEDLRVDMVVGEGDLIDLGGGVSLEAHLTPGHTRCSTSYLLQPDGVLIGGDNLGGYQSATEATPLFTSSYRDYHASLERLKKLEFDTLAMPHQGVLTGEDARRHLDNAIAAAERFRAELARRLEQQKTPEQIAEELLPVVRQGLAAEEPEFSTRINIAAMAHAVRKESERR